jgi:hypothetical protein
MTSDAVTSSTVAPPVDEELYYTRRRYRARQLPTVSILFLFLFFCSTNVGLNFVSSEMLPFRLHPDDFLPPPPPEVLQSAETGVGAITTLRSDDGDEPIMRLE